MRKNTQSVGTTSDNVASASVSNTEVDARLAFLQAQLDAANALLAETQAEAEAAKAAPEPVLTPEQILVKDHNLYLTFTLGGIEFAVRESDFTYRKDPKAYAERAFFTALRNGILAGTHHEGQTQPVALTLKISRRGGTADAPVDDTPVFGAPMPKPVTGKERASRTVSYLKS